MAAGPRYARSPAAALKKVGRATALYLKERRALHVLNPTAELLLRCLEEPATLAQLVELMSGLTDGSREEVERDLRELLPELEREQIVVRLE